MVCYEPASSRRAVAGQLLYFGAWLAVTLTGALLHPSADGHGTHTQLGLPPCPSVLLFNRPCPGCGLTTSWSAFIHGDFPAAFRAHPLGPLVYLFFTLTAFLALRGFATQRRFIADSPKFNRAVIVGAGLFFLFGIVRMLMTPHYATLHDIAAMR